MYLLKFESYADWENDCPAGLQLYETLDDFKALFLEEFFVEKPSKQFLDAVIENLVNGEVVRIKYPCKLQLGYDERTPIGYSQIDDFDAFLRIDGKPEGFLKDYYDLKWDMRFKLKDVGTPRRR